MRPTGEARRKLFKKGYLDDVVKTIDPEEKLSKEAEDFFVEYCIHFINHVTTHAAQNAKRRESEEIEASDIYHILESEFDMLLPGSTGIVNDENQVTKPTQLYMDKLSEVRKFMAKHNEE